MPKNDNNRPGQENLTHNVPSWEKKRNEGRKRKEQGQMRFVTTSGVYKDGKYVQQVAAKKGVPQHATLPKTIYIHSKKEVKGKPRVRGKMNKKKVPPPMTSSTQFSSQRVVEHGPSTNGNGGNKVAGSNTNKGMLLIMQKMQRMGYERDMEPVGNNQGIVEPIRAVVNSGKLALGAEKKKAAAAAQNKPVVATKKQTKAKQPATSGGNNKENNQQVANKKQTK